MLSMWLHFSICATIAFSALLLTQREASTQEGLSYKEKVALLLRGCWKVTHSTFSSLNTVHRFLVPGNTQKILKEIWHQFWQQNDGENICHWSYFQIQRALSELPANWPGLTRLSGWIKVNEISYKGLKIFKGWKWCFKAENMCHTLLRWRWGESFVHCKYVH